MHRAAGACLMMVIGCIALAGAAQTRPASVRVFVFTAPDGPDLKNRNESVKEVRSAMGGKYKGLQIVVPAALKREEADVVVEVLSREASATNKSQITVHLLLTAGSLTGGVDGQDTDGDWDDAASDAAEKAQVWIGGNRDRIMERTPSR